METNNQYREDRIRLAELINRFTGISKEQVISFILDDGVSEILSCANLICKNDNQREKLVALFEFKNLYETIKAVEETRAYNLSSPNSAMRYFKNYYADKNDKELFTVAFLDRRNNIIATKNMFSGTVDRAHVYVREIVKEALFYNASSVILAHNHPGGDLLPSDEDLSITERINDSLEIMGIGVYDHIIVARDKAMSFSEDDKMPASKSSSEITVAASPAQ